MSPRQGFYGPRRKITNLPLSLIRDTIHTILVCLRNSFSELRIIATEHARCSGQRATHTDCKDSRNPRVQPACPGPQSCLPHARKWTIALKTKKGLQIDLSPVLPVEICTSIIDLHCYCFILDSFQIFKLLLFPFSSRPAVAAGWWVFCLRDSELSWLFPASNSHSWLQFSER